jgi:hypothetical protein
MLWDKHRFSKSNNLLSHCSPKAKASGSIYKPTGRVLVTEDVTPLSLLAPVINVLEIQGQLFCAASLPIAVRGGFLLLRVHMARLDPAT